MSEKKPSRVLIYGLMDPTTDCLRYIGKTQKRRENRLAEHLESARNYNNSYVHSWIRMLLAKKIQPHIFILERVPGAADWREAEKRHIEFWATLAEEFLPVLYPPMSPKSTNTLIRAVKLTNLTQGGES